MKTTKQITWQSPSNIALIKYWGKHGINCRTTRLSVSRSINVFRKQLCLLNQNFLHRKKLSCVFYFEKKENLAFRIKILKFFESIHKDFSVLRDYSLVINSMNSFPHSSGIASSASAMSALALCLCSMDDALNKRKTPQEEFLQRASHYARLGSGSACRSVYPHIASWGKNKLVKGSSDKFATDCSTDLHPIFKTYQNSILIASSAEKKVSSRIGHSLMENNPFAEARYKQAETNFKDLYSALQTGDLEKFGTITENEALTLHALMMCSNPSFTLMSPNTLAMIEAIRDFRNETKLPVYFTLDAGPNIHLLYPKKIAEKVQDFIDIELKPLCENERIIWDNVGKGARIIK